MTVKTTHKPREKYISKYLAQEQKLTYIYRTLSEKKSQDRKEDRTENPEGSQDQSGFLLLSFNYCEVSNY